MGKYDSRPVYFVCDVESLSGSFLDLLLSLVSACLVIHSCLDGKVR